MRQRTTGRGTTARRPGVVLLGLLGLALGACGDGADVTVDPAATATATATASATATATATATAGAGTTGGETPTPTEAGTATPLEVTPPPDPCDDLGPDDDARAFILVTSPLPEATFPSGSTVAGCGNTFEAGFEWEVTDAGGSVVGSGFDMMTCGNGCVGTFSTTVTYEVSAGGPGTLTVFETSAADGSRQHVTELAVTLVAD
ncbi:MAG: Gmad2 immunoglobulin-like domain-containing protein [Actinomycetes bacterium]